MSNMPTLEVNAYQAKINQSVLNSYNNANSRKFILHLLRAFILDDNGQVSDSSHVTRIVRKQGEDTQTCAITGKPNAIVATNPKKVYVLQENETLEDRALFTAPTSEKLLSSVALIALCNLLDVEDVKIGKPRDMSAKEVVKTTPVLSPDATTYKKSTKVKVEAEEYVIPEQVPAGYAIGDMMMPDEEDRKSNGRKAKSKHKSKSEAFSMEDQWE